MGVGFVLLVLLSCIVSKMEIGCIGDVEFVGVVIVDMIWFDELIGFLDLLLLDVVVLDILELLDVLIVDIDDVELLDVLDDFVEFGDSLEVDSVEVVFLIVFEYLLDDVFWVNYI